MNILNKSIWAQLKNSNRKSVIFSRLLIRRRRSLGPNISPRKVNENLHVPVLVHEVAEYLQPENCSVILDATFGAGGHARELLKRSTSLKILCLDRDPLAFNHALDLQDEHPDQIIPLHGKFSDLPHLLESHNYRQNSLDGILFDFGCSSMQFDSDKRGFSHSKDAPLDMRMDGPDSNGITAADVLAHASETELHQIFKIYGKEPNSKKIAKAIVELRQSRSSPKNTFELRSLIESLFDRHYRFNDDGKFSHICTKIFLALRMFVNNEMNEISYAMMMAHRYLKIGGIMITISMNPLEDKIIKDYVTGQQDGPVSTELPLHFFSYNTVFDQSMVESLKDTEWQLLNKHVIVPNKYEASTNPRSRAAKLRACRKIA